MSYRLSLLDKSPVLDGKSPSEALADTVKLAQRAEALGYHRFWVAEHHGFPGLAGSAPEILAAYVLAKTKRIRVGSGGVMLQHYSPYKVAENFSLLSSLAPGRVDLGVGRAPGGFPLSSKALQWSFATDQSFDFEQRLAQLAAFLAGGLEPSHALAGAYVAPKPPAAPERFLLGAGVESARQAGEIGWGFVYAGQLNGDQANIRESFAAYRQAGGEAPPLLALPIFIARSSAEAKQQVAHLKVFKVFMEDGKTANLGSAALATEFARQAGSVRFHIEEKEPGVLSGTADEVRRDLSRLHEEFGVQEFVVDTPHAAPSARLRSIELLAQVHEALAA